jgi:hypothetical protein
MSVDDGRTSRQPIPDGVRVAVYNAMGGWGPYSVREIDELFRTYGFSETVELEDIGGVRRTRAEEYQRCIDWGDPDQRRRYLMLVEDVLSNYPDEDGAPSPIARKVRRALELANVALPSEQPAEQVVAEDIWLPRGGTRVFISHLATRREEIHELARMLRAFGFACFVAHDAIQPSRAWLREIERALRSCDLLVAYVTPGFRDSQWTDQEVGWVLGRERIVIPISVEGEQPYGFFGTYQAVRRREGQGAAALSREIFRAIADAVFIGQRAQSAALVDPVALMIANAFKRSTSFDNSRFWFEMVRMIPRQAWTNPVRQAIETGVSENKQVSEGVLEGGTPIPEALLELIPK